MIVNLYQTEMLAGKYSFAFKHMTSQLCDVGSNSHKFLTFQGYHNSGKVYVLGTLPTTMHGKGSSRRSYPWRIDLKSTNVLKFVVCYCGHSTKV